jgi:hypothetical protein
MATHPAPDVWELQGRRVDLPVTIETATFAGALWRTPRAAVDAQLQPYGLRAAGVRGTGLALLMCVQYGEFALGSYDEVGIGVYASPMSRTAPGWPGLFVLELPVTGAFTREAGREIWGLPKWLMSSTAEIGGSRSTMVMIDGGAPVMDATIRTAALPIPLPVPSKGRTWARAEDGPHAGRLLRGGTSMRFHGLRLGRGRGTTITWGEHRMADRARALEMDGRPFATFSAERLSASFGESHVVDG